jgi:excisionase family DNA binding protein
LGTGARFTRHRKGTRPCMDWMTVDEAAEYAGVSVATIRQALTERALDGVTTHPRAPGQWMVTQTELDRWLATWLS